MLQFIDFRCLLDHSGGLELASTCELDFKDRNLRCTVFALEAPLPDLCGTRHTVKCLRDNVNLSYTRKQRVARRSSRCDSLTHSVCQSVRRHWYPPTQNPELRLFVSGNYFWKLVMIARRCVDDNRISQNVKRDGHHAFEGLNDAFPYTFPFLSQQSHVRLAWRSIWCNFPKSSHGWNQSREIVRFRMF